MGAALASLSATGMFLLLVGCGSGSERASDAGSAPQEPSPGDASAADAANEGGAGDSAAPADGPFAPASHPSLPQVVNAGGPLLTAPKVQLIGYASDTGLSDITAFLENYTMSTYAAYWSAVTSEYGIGPLTVLPTITLTDTPPTSISDSTIQSTLLANTSGATPAWGAADTSTIYLFVYPSTTSVDSQGSGLSCKDFDAYHDATVGAVNLAYAVSIACPGFDGAGVNDLQERTVAISHELVEAATDPLGTANPAYLQEDEDDIVWSLYLYGELADMCEYNADTYYIPPGGPYMVQRSWSNAAAKASRNPCLPAPAVYFNSMPSLSPIAWSPEGLSTTISTKSASIPVGQTKIVDLKLFSSAPTSGPWTVEVYDYNKITKSSSAPNLDLSLDKSSGQNGDVLHLSITVESSNPTLYGAELFVVVSQLGNPGDADFQQNLAVGLVTN